MKRKKFLVVAALLANAAVVVPAQTVALLYNFTNSPDGANPVAGLVLAGGTLYGTTEHGGSNGVGTVFAVNTDGTGYTVLHRFADQPDGSHPLAGLVLSGGTLYGATGNGGASGYGSLFSLNITNGSYAVLHSFNVYSNGVLPNARLALADDTLYGTAAGNGYGSPGWGTVFAMNTSGSNYAALYNFTTPKSNGSALTNADGEQPDSGVVLAGGTLYGAAYGGGNYGYGTIYSLPTNGTNFTVLHSFSNNPDGAYPQGGAIVAGGWIYGTTEIGGTNGKGTLYAINTNGTGYQLLHHFATDGVDGIEPWANLTAAGGTLYGTTRLGGSYGKGTVFSVGTNGAGYRALYNFTNSPDGADPECDLLYASGVLYGTTEQGGSSIWGTVFSLALPALDINSFYLAGTNLVINAANGMSNTTYVVLASTNLTSPLAAWTPVATNTLSGNGNFTIIATNAVNASAPQLFYRLQAQ
jgi:uncharacterized repeat protein (TIGR03803 family)